ncbi:MAG: hypothetical protein HY337_01650 [Gemmatimonadetes bacterium]|nr:hypothetical protein [Gemmatimonadota bacterium]
MLETIFTLLFKQRPIVFQRGDVVFEASWTVLVLLALVGAAVVWIAHRRVSAVSARGRAVLIGVRLAVLALLLFALARPTLVVPTVVPQQNAVGVLVDDSRSMRVADVADGSRGAWVLDALSPEGANLLGRLSREFKVRPYRFANGVERLDPGATLTFDGSATALGGALDRVRRDLSTGPLAGIVVLSDGADNGEGGLDDPVLQLSAAGVPVYAVGVGRDRFTRDIEVARVELPRAALRGATVVADVLLSQRGHGGRSVRLTVEDGGRLLASDIVRLSGDGEATVARIAVPLSESGPRSLRFYVPPDPGEEILENNARTVMIEVRDDRAKILYFEGEPRFEVKFLRRAVAEDPNLQVVVLLRTADGKFLRLDVDDAEELAAGFPRTREELFAYRGVILGSVEASFFTHDQLRMLAEFVRQRGGGLLLLGGRRAMAEGGYTGTPLADALPVELEMAEDAEYFHELRVQPTPAGRTHPALQLSGTLDQNAARWDELPVLSTVNRLGRVKPGASTLLRGSGEGGDEAPVLVQQRYGAGRAAVFSVQDTWVWQMHADMAVDDLTHETLWRQLLRWLVSDVPDRVAVAVEGDAGDVGSRVRLAATVYDSAYLGLNDATVTARVLTPGGGEREVALEWDVSRDGEYRAGLAVEEAGPHEVRVEARAGERLLGSVVTHFVAGDGTAEFFGAEMRRAALERLAQETGGRFYTTETVGSLPEDIRYTERGNTVLERHELWDMPIVLLLLLGLLGTEWSLRRARGLA